MTLHAARSRLDAEIKRRALPWLTSIEIRADAEMLVLRCTGTGHERAWGRPPDDPEATIEACIPARPDPTSARLAERAGEWAHAADRWRGVAWAHRWWADRPGEDRALHLSRAAQASGEARKAAQAASRQRR